MTTRAADVPALITGAGLAGLSTAMFLGLHGLPSLVAERHPGLSTQPKARGQMPATMEALRAAGVAERFRAAAPPGRPETAVGIGGAVRLAKGPRQDGISSILGEVAVLQRLCRVSSERR